MLDHYEQLDPERIQNCIAANCYPMAYICYAFLPRMKKRLSETKLKSAIINISSLGCLYPMPYYNVYIGAKAFVDMFSRSLTYEFPMLDIMSVRPSEVSTAMTANK